MQERRLRPIRPGASAADELLQLQREDPLAFWLQRAHELSRRVRISESSILEARGIVVGAFGEHFIRDLIARLRGDVLDVYHGHPVALAFIVADGNDVVLILELATYLKRLATAAGIDKVIPSLRDDQSFDSALLQLAYAYRFQTMGAKVGLEPAAASGRMADIELEWEGRRYLIECYAEDAPRDPLKPLFAFTLPKLLRTAGEVDRVVRILLRLTSNPDDGRRRELESATMRMIRTIPRGGNLTAEFAFGNLEIHEISGQPEQDFLNGIPAGKYADAHQGMVLGFSSVERVLRPLGAWLAAEEVTSRAFCWRPPIRLRSKSERAKELYNKIAAKLPQARTEPGQGAATARRVVIAQVAEGRESEAQDDVVMQDLHRRLKRHRNIGAILVTSRRWTTGYRYRYAGSLLGVEPDPIFDAIFNRLGLIDHSKDVLRDL